MHHPPHLSGEAERDEVPSNQADAASSSHEKRLHDPRLHQELPVQGRPPEAPEVMQPDEARGEARAEAAEEGGQRHPAE